MKTPSTDQPAAAEPSKKWLAAQQERPRSTSADTAQPAELLLHLPPSVEFDDEEVQRDDMPAKPVEVGERFQLS